MVTRRMGEARVPQGGRPAYVTVLSKAVRPSSTPPGVSGVAAIAEVGLEYIGAVRGVRAVHSLH